jgi:hypothetical protein
MQCRPHRRSLGSNAWILQSATEPIAGRAHRKTCAMGRTVAASASTRQTSVTKTQVPCLVGGGRASRLKGCLTSGEASARWRNLMLAYRLDSLLGTSIPRTNGVFWMTESAPRPSGSIAVALSRAAGICRAPFRPANSQPSAINFPPGKTLRPGDILNTHNAHCLLFAGWNDATRSHLLAYETGSPPDWRVVNHFIDATWLKSLGYVPYRYRGMK